MLPFFMAQRFAACFSYACLLLRFSLMPPLPATPAFFTFACHAVFATPCCPARLFDAACYYAIARVDADVLPFAVDVAHAATPMQKHFSGAAPY